MVDLTTESLTANLSTAFESYMGELKQAGPHWDRKPTTDSEGEDAWCARQVAEHIAGAGPFFGVAIAKGAGLTAPAMAEVHLPSFEEAVAATENGHATLMGVIGQLTDEQLGIAVKSPQLGEQTLGSMAGIVVYHLNDHAQQLKTLRG